ncbi:MAG: molybdate ABC transporter permease subunit [Phycisphaerales bacterium]|nr:molybdate ABC transporter permease subunit [Phycisphaerales bacterium]
MNRRVVRTCRAVAVSLVVGLTAPAARGETITVSAAASLTDAMNAIRDSFVREHRAITVDLNFGASNHLQRQIEAGAGRGVDVFASAGDAPMDALIATGLVDAADRHVFAINTLVLVCPPENPTEIASFDALTRDSVRRIALGAAETPVGRYSRQSLEHLGISGAVEKKVVYAIHVRQALDYVMRGEVDAALVFATDAASAGSGVVVAATADPSWHEPIRYPIAVLRNSAHPAAARAFTAFVLSGAGQLVLHTHGFGSASSGTNDGVASMDEVNPPAESVTGYPASNVGDMGLNGHESRGGGWRDIWTAMKLSIIASVGAMVIVVPVGTALGLLLSRRRFIGRELLDAVLTLPMILPPTVTGYYLIVLFASASPVGRLLESATGIRVVLTMWGATMASAVVALPLMVRSARAAFDGVDRDMELASYTLGRRRVRTFWAVTLPLARNGLLAGAVLSFARAIGEFGATFMLAGIIPGRTMTMPSAIFHAFTNHDDGMVQTLVLILTLFSVAVIYLTNRLNVRLTVRAAE